ncbi:hypothetical protein F2Q70_00036669 [Brassica cretica]|uniref:Uncharacterized protein n=2 Tax=Brassica cretica TaxID=69181 RepID=A0A8S9JWR7_BRACR|nr:hypothetical protein F2Q70_00036669 [Brassica cretica]
MSTATTMKLSMTKKTELSVRRIEQRGDTSELDGWFQSFHGGLMSRKKLESRWLGAESTRRRRRRPRSRGI